MMAAQTPGVSADDWLVYLQVALILTLLVGWGLTCIILIQ